MPAELDYPEAAVKTHLRNRMADALLEVTRTNREFAQFLAEETAGDELFDEATDTRLVEQKMFGGGELIVPSVGRSMTHAEWRVKKLWSLCRDFWKARAPSYSVALREAPASTVFSERYDNALAAYFDVVVLPSDLHELEPEWEDSPLMAALRVATIRRWLHLIPILEADSDYPIVAFATPDVSPLQDPNGQAARDRTAQGEGYLQSLLTRVSKFAGAPELAPVWQELRQSEVRLDEFFDVGELKQLLSNYADRASETRGYFDGAKSHPELLELLEVKPGDKRELSASAFEELLRHLAGDLYYLAAGSSVAQALSGDQAITNIATFRHKLEIDGAPFAAVHGLPEEFVAAHVLELPPFKWFERIEIEDIVRIHELGGLEVLRGAFRSERSRIRNASPEDFGAIAKSVAENLSEQVREHERQLLLEKELYRKRLRRASLGFGGTLVLSFVSIAAPPVLWLTLPSALFSLAVGSKSAKDIAQEFLAGKRSFEVFGDRPLGIFARYLGQEQETVSRQPSLDRKGR